MPVRNYSKANIHQAARDMLTDASRAALTVLGEMFPVQIIGRAAASTDECVQYNLSRYETKDVRGQGLEQVRDSVSAMLEGIIHDIRTAAEAKANQGTLHLVWRHTGKILIESDYSKPGVDLMVRARFAIVSDADREAYRDHRRHVERVQDIVPARLYPDQEIQTIRTKTWDDAVKWERGQYRRILLIGLYYPINWWPLRQWRRLMAWFRPG